jgi:hypothetical protein
MQEYVLGVGEELVIEGGIRVTILAFEAGEVLLSITAPEPGTWDARRPATARRPAPRGRSAPPTSLPWEV